MKNVEERKKNKSKYDLELFLKMRLITQKLKLSSYKFYQKLKHLKSGKVLREIIGISLKNLPSYSTLRRYWENKELNKLMEKVQKYIVKSFQSKKEYLKAAIDSTKIPLSLKVHKDFGCWGRTSKDEKFFGLKLHLIVSIKGLPITWKITTGNIYDSEPADNLLTKLEKFKPVKAVFADAAYDSESIYHGVEARGLGTLSVSKLNSRRGTANTYARNHGNKIAKIIVKSKRQVIEQVFDILKEEQNLTIPWWCNNKEKIYNFISWNVHVLSFDMLLNKMLKRSSLDRVYTSAFI